MPFTLSHPAAVLPLMRHPFSPAALVCGAMAPDVPYFLAATNVSVSAQSWYEPLWNATLSHSLPGIAVSGPFALALLVLYCLVRRPVAALLPARLSPSATAGRGGGGWRRAGWVLLSVLIGVLTHLLWDSLTQSGGYLASQWSFLRAPVTGELTVARLVEHVSTVGGLAAVAVYLWRRARRVPSGDRGPGGLSAVARWSVATALAVAALVGAALATHPLEYYRGGPTPAERMSTQQVAEGMLADGIKGGGAAVACALLLYAVVWWAVYGARRSPSRPAAGQPAGVGSP